MLAKLFVVFTLVPLVELALLLRIGDHLGLGATLAIVIVTGLAGATLARQAGLRALQRIQADMAAARVPTDSLLDGLIILVAGVMLVTPGVLTDITALTLLTPFGRRPLRRYLKRRFAQTLTAPGMVIDVPARPPHDPGPGSDSPF